MAGMQNILNKLILAFFNPQILFNDSLRIDTLPSNLLPSTAFNLERYGPAQLTMAVQNLNKNYSTHTHKIKRN
jgi:hypothetical protein